MRPESTPIVLPQPTDPLERWEEFARETRLEDKPAGARALREVVENEQLDPEIRALVAAVRTMIVVTRPEDGRKILVGREQIREMQTARELAESGIPVADRVGEYYNRYGKRGGAAKKEKFSFGTLSDTGRKRGRPRRSPEDPKLMRGAMALDAEPKRKGELDTDLVRIREALLNGGTISGDTGF